MQQHAFDAVLKSLTYLGDPGHERIRRTWDRGTYIPEVVAGPNWWGRIVERIFGKERETKRDYIANFVNEFLTNHQDMLENTNRFRAHLALSKIAHRFHDNAPLNATIDRIIERIYSADNRAHEDHQQQVDRLRYLRESEEPRARSLEAHQRDIAALPERCKEIAEKRLAKIDRRIQADLERRKENVRFRVGREEANNNKLAADQQRQLLAEPPKLQTRALREAFNDDSKNDLTLRCRNREIVRANSFFFIGIPPFENRSHRPCVLDLSHFSREVVECFVKYHTGFDSYLEISVPQLIELITLTQQVIKAGKLPPGTTQILLENCEHELIGLISDVDTAFALNILSRTTTPRIEQHILSLMARDALNEPRILSLSLEQFTSLLQLGCLTIGAQAIFELIRKWASHRTPKDEIATIKLLNAPIPGTSYALIDYVPIETMSEEQARLSISPWMYPEKGKLWRHWFQNEQHLRRPSKLQLPPRETFVERGRVIDLFDDKNNFLGRKWALQIAKKDDLDKLSYCSKPWFVGPYKKCHVVAKLVYHRPYGIWHVYLSSADPKEPLPKDLLRLYRLEILVGEELYEDENPDAIDLSKPIIAITNPRDIEGLLNVFEFSLLKREKK